MNTKTIKNILLAGLVCCGFTATLTSCNDEWKDEQYEKYISFKAPLNDNGVTAVYVPYSRHNDDGSLTYGQAGISHYDLPIIVAGSTRNEKNLTIHVGHSDTLNILNYERFGSPTYRADIVDLYYKDMQQYASTLTPQKNSIRISRSTKRSFSSSSKKNARCATLETR